MTKVTLNKAAIANLKKNVKTAFKKTNTQLGKSFTEIIESETAFSDIGFTNWDIVDTGRLRDSQHCDVIIETDNKIEEIWTWDPVDPETGRNYAGDVLVGFVSINGNWIPGRNWPERGVENLNPVRVFKTELKALL